jgi:hypothetical protein
MVLVGLFKVNAKNTTIRIRILIPSHRSLCLATITFIISYPTPGISHHIYTKAPGSGIRDG